MNKRNYISTGVLLFMTGFFACTDMDETMMKFVDSEALTVYAPKINTDSVEIFAGHARLKLAIKDLNPRVSQVMLTWDDSGDPISAPVQGTAEGEPFTIVLSDLAEGGHTIEVVTFDNFGNRSIKTLVSGNVYGDAYISTLKPRVIKDVVFNEAGNVEVIWSGANEGTIGTVLTYQDVSGEQHAVFESIRDTTEIVGFKPNEELTYQTLFLPEPTAIDTFYSDYGVHFIEGPRIDLAKAGWTADASSYDGRSCCRIPASAIDDDLATEWVNSIVPQTDFPHTFSVDLGAPQPLRGVSLVQRQNSNASMLKDFEVLVSVDGVTWNSAGHFTATNVKSKQYFDFPPMGSVQHFRLVCKSANDNGKNLAVAEIGAFIR